MWELSSTGDGTHVPYAARQILNYGLQGVSGKRYSNYRELHVPRPRGERRQIQGSGGGLVWLIGYVVGTGGRSQILQGHGKLAKGSGFCSVCNRDPWRESDSGGGLIGVML